MNPRPAIERTNAAFDGLAAPRRRYLLSVLYGRREFLSVETLATEVAVCEHQSPIVSDEQVRSAHIELVHNHVPRLLDSGLLTEKPDDGTRRVALADRSLFDADWVRFLLENPTGGSTWEEQRLNRTLEALRPARRRTICDVLARRPDGLDVADLAATLAAREQDTRLVDVDESTRAPIESRLVHDDLPALEDAGLVRYDRSNGTVAIERDAPQWRAEWLAGGPLGGVTAALETSTERGETGGTGAGSGARDDSTNAGACWTLEGEASIVARSHEIADGADEELFVTVPETGLISQRCLERWQAAVDRGIDLYAGSQSPCVRDTVESAIPAATICEPQYDWLNFPAEQVNHGHVVLGDREQVMLVTLDERSDGAGTEESSATAITAEGEENALVRLVREQVGPRLDRLQSRYEDDSSGGESTPLPL